MSEAIYALAIICLAFVALAAIGTGGGNSGNVAGKAIDALTRILKK